MVSKKRIQSSSSKAIIDAAIQNIPKTTASPQTNAPIKLNIPALP